MDSITEEIVASLKHSASLHLALASRCAPDIARAVQLIERCFSQGGKVLLFGNGGSAADAQHIAAEFVGRFSLQRDPLPAIALTTDSSALTAIGNDFGFDQIFARQIRAIGNKRDVAIAISTSGRSPNVLTAVIAARQKGLSTIGLTGGDGGELASSVDVTIVVPSDNTARIQECHLAIEHILCERVEEGLARVALSARRSAGLTDLGLVSADPARYTGKGSNGSTENY